jgi:hypothetical protein
MGDHRQTYKADRHIGGEQEATGFYHPDPLELIEQYSRLF